MIHCPCHLAVTLFFFYQPDKYKSLSGFYFTFGITDFFHIGYFRTAGVSTLAFLFRINTISSILI